MKPPQLIVTLSVSASLLVGCGQPGPEVQETQARQKTAKAVARYPLEDLMDSVSYRGLFISPDGNKILTSSNAGGTFDLVELPLDGSAPRNITDAEDDTNMVVGYFPDDERILYASDQGGNEQFRLYVRSPDGSIRDLALPGRTRLTGWKADGSAFFTENNRRDPRVSDVYEVSTSDLSKKQIFKNEDLYIPGPVSVDGNLIALAKISDDRSQHLEIYNVKKAEYTAVTAENMHVWSGGMTSATASTLAFSPDGEYLYYTTDKWHEFQYLKRYHIPTGKQEEVVRFDWDVTSIQISRDGSAIVVKVNENAKTALHVYDTSSLQRIGGTDFPDAAVSSYDISNDGAQLAYIVRSGRMPGDIFTQNVVSGDRTRLAKSLSDRVKAEDLVLGEVIEFSSHDGLHVPGVIYKPHGVDKHNKAPAVVYIHGGPGGESGITYEPWVQYIVNNGYVLFAVNNRGSSGSGKTFFHMSDQAHGRADLKDIVASKGFLNSLEFVEHDQVAVFGASYGGFLTLAAMTNYPDTFKAGIDVFGVTNWLRTFKMRPPWWDTTWIIREYGLGDNNDEEYWKALSPLLHASRISRPLLVLQGANDPRVPKVESDELVEKVKANGVPVEYVIFEDEGHGFNKKKNQVAAYGAMIRFLDRYVAEKAE